MAPLRAWIVPKLLKLLSEDADPLSAIIEKGGDVQILHFITWESPFWAIVGDQEHRIVVRFANDALVPLKKLDASIPSFRYAIIALSSYQPLLVAAKEGAPKEIAFKIHALRLKSQTETVQLNERLRDVSSVRGPLAEWVRTLSVSSKHGKIETVPPPSQDPSIQQLQQQPPSVRSDHFPTPRARMKVASSSPPISERLGMEWWEMSPTPEPEEEEGDEQGGAAEEGDRAGEDVRMQDDIDASTFPPAPSNRSLCPAQSSSDDELQVRPAKTRQTLHLRTSITSSASNLSASTSTALAANVQPNTPQAILPHASPSSAPPARTDSSQTDPPSQPLSQPQQHPSEEFTPNRKSPQSSQTDTCSSPSETQRHSNARLGGRPSSTSPPDMKKGSTSRPSAFGPTSSKVLVENSDSERSFSQSQSQSQPSQPSQPSQTSHEPPTAPSLPLPRPSTVTSLNQHDQFPLSSQAASAAPSPDRSVYAASSRLYVPSTLPPHSTDFPPAGQKRLQALLPNGGRPKPPHSEQDLDNAPLEENRTDGAHVGEEGVQEGNESPGGSSVRPGGLREITMTDESVRLERLVLEKGQEIEGEGRETSMETAVGAKWKGRERARAAGASEEDTSLPSSTAPLSDATWAKPSFLSSRPTPSSSAPSKLRPSSPSEPAHPCPSSPPKDLKRKATKSPSPIRPTQPPHLRRFPSAPSIAPSLPLPSLHPPVPPPPPPPSWDSSSRPSSTQHPPQPLPPPPPDRDPRLLPLQPGPSPKPPDILIAHPELNSNSNSKPEPEPRPKLERRADDLLRFRPLSSSTTRLPAAHLTLIGSGEEGQRKRTRAELEELRREEGEQLDRDLREVREWLASSKGRAEQ